MKSKESLDVYSTHEPQTQFHQRISFCLNLHNESVKALRFPESSTHKKELISAEELREEERKLVQEIMEGEDEDDVMDEF